MVPIIDGKKYPDFQEIAGIKYDYLGYVNPLPTATNYDLIREPYAENNGKNGKNGNNGGNGKDKKNGKDRKNGHNGNHGNSNTNERMHRDPPRIIGGTIFETQMPLTLQFKNPESGRQFETSFYPPSTSIRSLTEEEITKFNQNGPVIEQDGKKTFSR